MKAKLANGGSCYERWMTSLRGSESTAKTYKLFLERYLKFTRSKPDELIADRAKTLKSEDMFVKRKHEEMLDRFFKQMEKDKYSRNTCVLAFATVRSFYKANYVKLEVVSPETWVTKSYRAIRKKDLKAMVEAADFTGQSYILCQASSGISIEDLLAVTLDTESEVYGTIKQQLREGIRPVNIHLRREKSKQLGYFDTFISTEAADVLDEYIGKRSKGGLWGYSKRHIQRIVTNVADAAGLKGVSTHSLRKFFTTQMKLADVNESIVEHMVGHTLGGSKGAYFIPPVEELRKKYVLVEPSLTVGITQ